jgi:transcriptional regulator with PAS, ATPase and Fis domain
LNVIPIHIPPLRDRRDDIAALALNRLEKFNQSSSHYKRLDPAVMDRLTRYNYPGNVRELINIMERIMIMSDGHIISLSDIPEELRESDSTTVDPFEEGVSLKKALKVMEVRIIEGALRQHKSLSITARALNVHPTTLWRKMAKLGVSKNVANRK